MIGLRHIYIISELINEAVNEGKLPKDFFNNFEAIINVDDVTFHGIDKEFYYMTHDNNYDGFEHSKDLVTAKINNIKFNILPKNDDNHEK